MSGPAGLALVGLMGSGKSTVAAVLGDRLGIPVIDTDELVEQRVGSSIPAIFEEVGESGFRRFEIECVADAIASLPCVIATGGGVVATDDGRALLGAVPLVVHLEVSPSVAAARLGHDSSRPMLSTDPLGRLERLHAERAPWYDEVADVVVVVDGKTPEEIVSQIIDRIEES